MAEDKLRRMAEQVLQAEIDSVYAERLLKAKRTQRSLAKRIIDVEHSSYIALPDIIDDGTVCQNIVDTTPEQEVE